MTAPQWPNLNNRDGLQITDTAQQISQLQPDLSQFPVSAKDSYVWGGLNDPNLIANWPQPQMPQFPMKTFPQKPSYTQYQSDVIPKTVGLNDQPQQKNQQQYNVNWPISESNMPNLQNLPNLNHPNHNNEEILPEKDSIGVIKDIPVPDRKKDGKHLLISSKTDSKSTEDSDYNNEEEEETTTEPPKKKKKHRKVNKIGKQSTDEQVSTKDSSAHQLKIIHTGLQAEFMDHDGEADRPGGAVVSLALGKH